MTTTQKEQEYQKLAEAIVVLCRQFRECCVEAGRNMEREKIRRCLRLLCRRGRKRVEEDVTGLWLALMDAYEILHDEKMLQEVLDRVSQIISQLQPSIENIKLLSYCYYYVEDEECLVLVKQTLGVLQEGKEKKKFEEALVICREFMGDSLC